jgi:serine/threonine protein kinase
VKRLAVQILHSLVFLRTQNIIHCDLKPENILLQVKIDLSYIHTLFTVTSTVGGDILLEVKNDFSYIHTLFTVTSSPKISSRWRENTF